MHLICQRCPQKTSRIFFLPMLILGVVGFIINIHFSVMSSHDGICYPKSNIVFLKTHKCAGSSIQNILMRYGDAKNLTFVLPRTGNYLGHPAPFSRALLPFPRLPYYNILAHHTRLDYKEIKRLMPGNTAYITIVRDPVQIFESSFSYYGLNKFFHSDFRDFIRDLPHLSKKFVDRRYREKFGTNQMMFDLGANPDIFENDTLVNEYVQKLDQWFDLVLVADRMDESLILMKRFLCWDIDDVVTFKLNARSPKFKSELNDEEKEALRKLNHADAILYSHFLEKFEKEIEQFGRERMASEIKELKLRTQKWYDLCIRNVQPFVTPQSKPKYYYNPKVMVFETNKNINNQSCSSMTMEELPFTDHLREKQMRNYPRRYKKISFHRKVIIRKPALKVQNALH
ncbi:galactosylceramide sulfotransferase-like [Uloborus diversus]|uniref:galactosylceramide sulfotransferase-like n=1 Tax=Uloborus diversus TaxID=327109 RepID=UPI002409D872|nr:galactosylceramide sulfotransferase-like [Uloborus diversus]